MKYIYADFKDNVQRIRIMVLAHYDQFLSALIAFSVSAYLRTNLIKWKIIYIVLACTFSLLFVFTSTKFLQGNVAILHSIRLMLSVLMGVIGGMLLFHDTISKTQWIGLGIITIGIALLAVPAPVSTSMHDHIHISPFKT